MTIAIDFVGINIGSGTKTYNVNFCNELEVTNLKEDIIIFVCKNYINQISFGEKKNSKIKYILKPNFFSNTLIRLIWMQFILPFELKLRKVKKLYSPMNFCPIFTKFSKIKVVLALHSNLPWVYFNLMPGNLFRNFITKKLMEMSIFTCQTLIVNSYFARDQIANILKLNKDKIQVIYLGIDRKYLSIENSKNFLSTLDYNKKYMISVLSCVKYHNILNLLKAYKILIKEIDFEIKFVLVLQILDKKYFNILNEFINKNFDRNKIIIMNNIDTINLVNLYKHSQLYIFSSYCEVFGLTSLEAMSQGCPVLISNTSALPEINDKAADYFNPDDIFEIKNKMLKNLTDINFRLNLIKTGNFHFKKFNWKNNISKTLSTIYSISAN